MITFNLTKDSIRHLVAAKPCGVELYGDALGLYCSWEQEFDDIILKNKEWQLQNKKVNMIF